MLKRIKVLALGLALLLGSAAQSQAAFVYVGSWDFITLGGLSNGVYGPSNPLWWEGNPAVYNALEAAAILFGGSASDYAISTLGTDPNLINNMAYVDGWGDTTFLTTPAAETFKLDSGAPGYNDPFGGPAFSALVFDHGPGFPNSINYAFRRDNNAVPEPATMALLGIGFAGIGTVVRRRKTA